MEQEVAADAASFERDIALTGHAAVSGIYFDFDKDKVKPESKAALDEVDKLQRANPDMKFYVVGHSDSKEKLDYNLDLSIRRAKAVGAHLTAAYNISASRLAAHGVGPLTQVLSNKDESRQAKNLRVELVEQ